MDAGDWNSYYSGNAGCFLEAKAVPAGPYTMKCSQVTKGRYLSVALLPPFDGKFLEICEIQAFYCECQS